MPKIIPKPMFQVFALGALALAWGGTAVLAWAHVPPVSWLADAIGPIAGWFVAWILATFVWVIVILPFRLMTPFATLEETLRAQGARDVRELFDRERAKARNIEALPARERRARYLLMGAASLVTSLAFGVLARGARG